MNTDRDATSTIEADLRREFDAVRAPGNLTFSPESVLGQGSRTIRRHRILTVGSAAMAVGLLAVGTGLMNRPHDSAAPQPATRTADTGIVRASLDSFPLTGQVEFNRDPRIKSNVKFVVGTKGQRQVVGVASTAKPGQKAEATWRSGMVGGHPFTFGLVPGNDFDVKLADGASYGITNDEVKGTGYSVFSVMYKNGDEKEPARPAQIASISWSGPNGIVDGIEGDHRLIGQILKLDRSVSVKVLLRPGECCDPGSDERTTVFGKVEGKTASGGAVSTDLSVSKSDPSEVAVVTGRYPVVRAVNVPDGDGPAIKGSKLTDGPPVAAGILPAGASDIVVVLTTNEAATGLAKSERLADGRVIFALNADFGRSSDPSKDSIKAVTWTNANGTKGRKAVTQKLGG